MNQKKDKILTVLFLLLIASGYTSSKSAVGLIDGDVVIGGLFPVHQLNSQNTCGKNIKEAYGILRLEAMVYAIDQINRQKFLPIKLGAEIRDSCNLEPKALDESLQFVIDSVTTCQPNVGKGKNEKLVGVVGASLTSVTAQVASLLRLFKIPQISYGSTSIDLSEQAKYGYLLRTVPSDFYQARAMVDFIANTLNWTTIYGINTLGSYGTRGMEAFKKAAKAANICIVDTKAISLRSELSTIEKVLRGFYKEKGVRGVVLFCEMESVRRILVTAQSLKLQNHFRWVASEGWGFKHPKEGLKAAEEAVTLSLHFPKQKLKGFYDYFGSLTPATVDIKKNPWFNEFWNEACNRATTESGKEIDCRAEKKEESIPSTFSLCDSYAYHFACREDDKVPFVIDAVYSFAYALRRLLVHDCKKNIECLRKTKGTTFFQKYLKNVTFEGLSGAISFGKGVLKGSYDFNWFRNGTFEKIGTWKSGKMEINTQWLKREKRETIKSSCGNDCPLGFSRTLKTKNNCCWSCTRCRDNQYLKSLYECEDCLPGFQPNMSFSGCKKLPLHHWSSAWHITISLLASVGLCLTLFVTAVYIKYNHTPVIKASGRELQYTLLCGLGLTYSLPFVIALYPQPTICAVVRFGTSFCICICYAALLVKTNRIARIFSGTQDPLFITPVWQVALTTLFLLPQILIGITGLITTPPAVIYDHIYKKYSMVQCNSSSAELVISMGYNLLLVFICTIYAFFTRKVPENFNEARYVVFVMYTTCAIWLTFLPVFYGANADYRSIAISLNLILNATTILVGLFAIKIYVVLLKPEKNISANSRVRSKSEHSLDRSEIYKASYLKGDSPLPRTRPAFTITSFESTSTMSLRDGYHNGQRETRAVSNLSSIKNEMHGSNSLSESLEDRLGSNTMLFEKDFHKPKKASKTVC